MVAVGDELKSSTKLKFFGVESQTEVISVKCRGYQDSGCIASIKNYTFHPGTDQLIKLRSRIANSSCFLNITKIEGYCPAY